MSDKLIAILILLGNRISALVEESTSKANQLAEYATAKIADLAAKAEGKKKSRLFEKLFKTHLGAKAKILVAACQVQFLGFQSSLINLVGQEVAVFRESFCCY